MIRSLINIAELSVIDQKLAGNITQVDSLEFDSEAFGKGGFGTVHHVDSLNQNRSNKKFLVKLLTNVDTTESKQAFETITLFHKKVKHRQFRTGLPIYHEFPELLGLPFAVFKAYDPAAQTNCIAMLMFNLVNLGYEDISKNSNTLQLSSEFDLVDKIGVAYQLVRVIAFLHSIFYINSDLSIQSVFTDSASRRLALIDYDGGYFFDEQKNPITQGKISYWASKVVDDVISLVRSHSTTTTSERIQNEYYAIAVATFELLFSTIPFFFLRSNNVEVKTAYGKRHTWPEIDFTAEFASPTTAVSYSAFIERMKQYEQYGLNKITDSFRKVFSKGYDYGDHRTTAKEWTDILREVLTKEIDTLPNIVFFNSSRDEITKPNQEVTFYWKIENGGYVKINGQLVDLLANSITLPVSETTTFRLEATNAFGTNVSILTVEAIKVQPRIQQFTPSHFIRQTDEPITVRWETSDAASVEISSHSGVLPTLGTVDIFPTGKTICTLTAVGHFGQRVTSSIELSVVVPTIQQFTYRVELNGGLDNIELNYRTEGAHQVELVPNLGDLKSDSSRWVRLNGPTEFTLIAKSHFAETSAQLTAVPFPVPLVRQITLNIPPIELVADVSSIQLNAPLGLTPSPEVDLKFSGFEKLSFVKLDMTQLQPANFLKKAEVPRQSFPSISTNTRLFDKILEQVKNTLIQKPK